MATQATMPKIQLGHSPAEPVGPPPSRKKFLSMGAMVWPFAYQKMRPRQTRNPPSVTMNAGTRPYAMMKPWSPPMSAPTPIPTARAMIQVYGWSNPSPRFLGIQTAWTMAIV